MSWQIFPHPMVILQIPVLTALYSESLSFGRPGLGRSTPHQIAISQITVKFIFHSYPESSTFGWPGFGRSNPPPIKWQFHRFLLWQLTTLKAQQLADQFLADLPPVKWQFHRLLLWQFIFHSYSESSIIWQTRSWQIYPLIKWQFYRFLLWQLPTLRAHTFDRPSVGRSDPPHQMEISQIPEKFIFHSYSESSTFGRPGLGRSMNPYQMAILQIPALLWKLIFVRPSVGRSTPTHQW